MILSHQYAFRPVMSEGLESPRVTSDHQTRVTSDQSKKGPPLSHAPPASTTERVLYVVGTKYEGQAAAAVHLQKNGGWRLLHGAASIGHVEVVATLVELGADVNMQTNDGRRPLHCAAFQGHVEVVATLIQLGAESKPSPPVDTLRFT
jgi:ankyrin repeat protein